MVENKNQQRLKLVARIFLGLLFIISAWAKAGQFAGVVGYMTKNGVPAAQVLLVLTLIVEFGAGALLIFGWQARYAALTLIVFVAVVTPIFHAFWNAEGAQVSAQLNNFFKNVAIIGGLLYVFISGPGKLGLGKSDSE